jgi:hypothetical protein
MVPSINELSSLLTPSLFYQVLKNCIPWLMEKALDFKVYMYVFLADHEESQQKELRDICQQIHKAVSKLGVSTACLISRNFYHLSSPKTS